MSEDQKIAALCEDERRCEEHAQDAMHDGDNDAELYWLFRADHARKRISEIERNER